MTPLERMGVLVEGGGEHVSPAKARRLHRLLCAAESRDPEHQFVDVHTVASLLDCSARKVWGLASVGRLMPVEGAPSGTRWRLSDVHAYMDSLTQADHHSASKVTRRRTTFSNPPRAPAPPPAPENMVYSQGSRVLEPKR